MKATIQIDQPNNRIINYLQADGWTRDGDKWKHEAHRNALLGTAEALSTSINGWFKGLKHRESVKVTVEKTVVANPVKVTAEVTVKK